MRLFQFVAQAITAISLYTTFTAASSQSREPLNYLSILENPRIHAPSKRVNAYSSFDLTFDLHKRSQHVRLSLEPNHDIFHEDAQINYLGPDGIIKYSEKVNREEYKVFQGQSYVVDADGSSEHVGWARIMVNRDGVHPLFEGAFTVMGDHHHIHLTSSYMSTKHVMDPDLEVLDDEYMVVWRDSDIGQLGRTELRKRSPDLTCSADKLPFNSDLNHPIFRELLKRGESQWGVAPVDSLLGKRQIDGGTAGNGNGAGVNLRSTIGSTVGCPSQRKVALVGVATDCTYAQDFNSTESVRQNVIKVVNTASELYQSTFNITLGLRNLTLQDRDCPGTANTATPWNVGCNDAVSITDRLGTFSAWRATQGDTNAFWSLFTKCSTGAEVGLAWLGQLCIHGGTAQQAANGKSSTVTGANVVARTSTEWQVFAHETGHTFGAVHDCDSSACASGNTVSASQCCPLSQSACNANAQYLMNPYAAGGITRFSPCSIGNICSAIGRNSVQSGCLTDNKGVVTITGNQCGNGIVEDGEDCDCGGAQGCGNNRCCNPTTCKFVSGAVCDPSNEGCCTTQCQFAGSGTVCRASTGSCDPQETCPGTNGTCPRDVSAPDGQSCGSGLQCASGHCTSRDLQCKTLMGSYTQNNDTYACNSQTCQLRCASPDFGAGVCYSMSQNFLDGTICGGSGRCSNGVCSGSNVGGEIKSWIDDNKTLVIALASVIGGLILLGILGCIVRACRRPRGKRMPAAINRQRRGVHGPQPPRGQQGWDGPGVPPQMMQRGYGGAPNQWQPQQPAPTYSYNSYGPSGQSVRYA